MYRLIKLTVLLHLLAGIDGAITLNCWATSPVFRHSVTCSCKNLAGTGVEWWENTNLVSICFFSVNCSPNPSGYTFSVNQTEQMFTMTVNPYNYSECQQFTCKDFTDTSIQQSQKPLIIDFDSTMPLAIAEPALDNTDGDISITTSCISGYSDLIAKWYIVVDGTKKEYIPDQDIVIRQINATACIACNSESAATIKLGFQHKEAVANEASEGHFQLELYHPDNPLQALVLNTSNVYKVTISGYSDGSNGSGCGLICIVLICVVVVVCAVIIIIVIVVKEKPKQVKEFRVKEVADSTIVVMWDKNTKYCCQAKYILSCLGKKTQVLPYTVDEFEFTNLSSGKTYSLEIQEKICIGIQGQKSTMYVRTKGPPAKPIDFKAAENGIAERTITVQWNPGDDGGHPQTFVLTYANATHNYIIDYQAGHEALEYTFIQLSEGTNYNFSIFARNKIGTSQVDTLYLRTNGKPDPPKDFHVVHECVTGTSILVRWKPGADGGFKQQFTITCTTGNKTQNKEVTANSKSKVMQCNWTHLSEETWYQITIVSSNTQGNSWMLKPLLVRTLGPHAPRNLKVLKDAVTESSIVVEWKPILMVESPKNSF